MNQFPSRLPHIESSVQKAGCLCTLPTRLQIQLKCSFGCARFSIRDDEQGAGEPDERAQALHSLATTIRTRGVPPPVHSRVRQHITRRSRRSSSPAVEGVHTTTTFTTFQGVVRSTPFRIPHLPGRCRGK